MNFSQRRFFTSTQFELTPLRLKYTFRNLSGSRQTSIDYMDISFDVQRIVERHSSYLYLGLIFFGLGSIMGAVIYSTEDRLSGFNYTFIGVVLLAAFFLQQRQYTVLTAGSETLLVLGGGSSTEILNAISHHRRQRFLEILRRPDMVADEGKQRALVSWLVERGALSEQEASAVLQGAVSPVQTDAGRAVH